MKNFSQDLHVTFALQADRGKVELWHPDTGEILLRLEDLETAYKVTVGGNRPRKVWQLPGVVLEALDLAQAVNILPKEFEPYERHLPVHVTYSGPEENKRLASLFGPKFPQRWFLANRYAFIEPLEQIYGSKLVHTIARSWPAGMWLRNWLSYLHESRFGGASLVNTGHAWIMPLCPGLGLDPNDPLVLKHARGVLSRDTWHKLSQTSWSRLKLLSSRLEMLRFDQGFSGNRTFSRTALPPERVEEMAQLLERVVRLPSTLLHFLHDFRNKEELELLGNLAQHRPVPYKQCEDYRLMLRMWADVKRHRPASVTWSPRRILDEHGRMMREQRQIRAAEEAKEREQMRKPFEHLHRIPNHYTDRKYGFTVRLLNTADKVINQGRAEGHCLDMYWRQAADGQVYCYSFEKDGEVLTTATYQHDGLLWQNYGKYNTVIKDPALIEAVDYLGKTINLLNSPLVEE